ncbi:MAG: hypothetical protein Aurels2KO_43150 [Aureliella sp.]
MTSSAEPKKEGKLHSIMKRVPGGALMFAVLPLAILSYLAWYYYGAEHLDKVLYSLRPENVEITQQPEWIRGDVAQEVFEKHDLSSVSLLDPQSNAFLARAFESSPWIKSTTRVSKSQGGKVQIDLVYRQPIAMVYLRYKYVEDGEEKIDDGCFPVDKDAIILPSDSFTENDIGNYLVILAQGAESTGELAGSEFGDPAVKVAVDLCAMLAAGQEQYGLKTVQVERDYAATGSSPWKLTIHTKDGRKILWGRPPNHELHGEPPARDKIARMVDWLKSGTADSSVLDLQMFARTSRVSTPLP